MNDRFKYRFYDHTDKKLGEVINIDFNNEFIDFKTKDGCTSTQLKCGEILQCTGLKDKNGKLIYEGDIVRFNWNPILNEPSSIYTFELPVQYYLEWGCFAFHIEHCKCTNKQLNLFENNDFKDLWVAVGSPITYGGEYNDVEVISNAFENPELLEEKC